MDAFLLAFARAAGVVALHPVFGGRSLPRPVAAGIAAALAFALMPETAGPIRLPLALLLAKEAAVGAALGVLGQLAFGAIQAAARLADDARGAGAAQVYAPQTESFPSPLAALDLQLAVALFWTAGLHATLIAALAESYRAVPVGAIPRPDGGGLAVFLEAAGRLARAAVAVAAPAVAACALADALFGLVNRSAPQANVFFLSLASKLLVALLLTAATLPGRVQAWSGIWSLERATWAGFMGGV